MAGLDLGEHVLAYFLAEAVRFGLDAGALSARRVLNWGGFVSHSYRVGDGEVGPREARDRGRPGGHAVLARCA